MKKKSLRPCATVTKAGSDDVRPEPDAPRERFTRNAVTLAILGVLMLPTLATAVDWSGANSTDWNDAANWIPASVPDAQATATIDNGISSGPVISAAGATAGVIVVGNAAAGEVTVNGAGSLTTNDAVVGHDVGGQGVVTVTGPAAAWTTTQFTAGKNGQAVVNVSNGAVLHVLADAVVGENAGSNGTISVSGGKAAMTVDGNFLVGVTGAGQVDVVAGGTVDVKGGTSIGQNTPSAAPGQVNVSGVGAKWTSAQGMTIGDFGTGGMLVEKAAMVQVTGGTTVLGAQAAGNGSLKVDGAFSSFSTVGAGTMTVGDLGVGDVQIVNGGTMTTDTVDIGGAVTGQGTVKISGNGSTLTNNNRLTVGLNGNGTLTVEKGGQVTTDGLFIGQQANIGTVNIDGLGSALTYKGGTIGDHTTGTMSITNQAIVTSTSTDVLGNAAGGSGTVKVDGDGTAWSNFGMLIGNGGVGQVQITNGAVVTTDIATLGFDLNSNGNITVVGAKSKMDVLGALNVGLGGTGTVNVANGGSLSAGNVTVAIGPDVRGAITAVNAGSLSFNGALVVGEQGIGDFKLLSGSTAEVASNVIFGRQLGSQGTALIDGGSVLLANGQLRVGENGTGVLDIRNGAAVSVANTVNIGVSPTGIGVITIDGNGSILDVNGGLTAGDVGNGTLAVTNGGAAFFNSGVESDLALSQGAKSTVVVSGAGSSLTTGTLAVGLDGDADLQVLNGAKLTSGGAAVGFGSTGSGKVLVAGSNSDWDAGLGLVIGGAGRGTVSVANGGHVATHGDLTVGASAGSQGQVLVTSGGSLDAVNVVLGDSAGSNAVVEVDGVNSVLRASGNFIVGFDGRASLTVSNGGVVDSPKGMALALNLNEKSSLNIGAAPGAAPVAAGVLNTPFIEFGGPGGAINFNHTDANYVFAPAVVGDGTVNQIAGVTNMTGNSKDFFGPTNILGGRMAVNGSLANSVVTVSGAGTLGGSGTVGNVAVLSGGTIAPGNSIGTLNVNGNIAFAPGSTYNVEVNAAGQSDRIAATGAASLGGDVKVLAGTGNYDASTKYTILTAGGGRTGAFDSVVSDMAFLSPSLSYDANAAYLTLTRNAISFCGVGYTVNQCATGAGVESLGLLGVNGLYGRILTMDAASARYAFDQLSGEVHASARSVLIEDSRFLREAALDRLRPTGSSDTREGARSAQGLAVWSRAIGSWGRLDGGRNGNSDGFGYHAGTAKVSRDMGGLLVGADVDLGDTWRAGVVGGFSHTSFKANERSSSGNSDNYHLGIYGGASFGGHKEWGVRTGLAYTRHRVETSRTVSFPGFADSLRSDSSASTTQAFGELGYKLQGEAGILEPFANLAHVNYSSGRFNERGGLAALTSLGGSTDVTYTTLGVRGSTKLDFGSGSNVTARGTLGWAHALGSTTPKSQMAFAGGTPFTISGVPLAKNVAVVEAGLDFAITPSSTLSVSYGGQFGSGVRDQGVKANLSVKF